MESNVSDLVVGLMMAVFGLVGLFLVAGAADNEMYVFGIALFVFAVCFNTGLIRRHFDRRDALRAAIREPSHV
jgi:FtsH-binding integral membrane protein